MGSFRNRFKLVLAFDIVGRPMSRLRSLWNRVRDIRNERQPPCGTQAVTCVLPSPAPSSSEEEKSEDEEHAMWLADLPESPSRLGTQNATVLLLYALTGFYAS